MENSVDPVHTEWLHGKFYEFVREEAGERVAISAHHVKIGFEEFEFGMYKRRLLEGQSEESDDWRVGHPILFPHVLGVGGADAKTRPCRRPVPRFRRICSRASSCTTSRSNAPTASGWSRCSTRKTSCRGLLK